MKNKFALCFRPVVMETEEPDPDDHHDHNHIVKDVAASADIIVPKTKKNNGIVAPAMIPSILDSTSRSLQASCYPQPKNHSRKTLFSRILKTILFETSPRMRADQAGKTRELTFPEKTNDLEESNYHMEKMDDGNKMVSRISSSSSSSSAVSSSSDQSSKDLNSLSVKRSLARSSSNSFNQKKKARTTKTNDKVLDSSLSTSKNIKSSVFYWIVLALLANIIWGKLFAVILSSIWLYFIPCRSGIDQRLPESNAVKLPEIETSNYLSREYKKRIIMEGLLERKPLQRALNF